MIPRIAYVTFTLLFATATFGAVWVSPPTPTTTDTITLSVSNYFDEAVVNLLEDSITQDGNAFTIGQLSLAVCGLPYESTVSSAFLVHPLPAGTYTVTANVHFLGPGEPPCIDSMTQTASFTVVPAGVPPDVSIAKTTTTAAYVPGGNIDYTITVTNEGPSPATNVVVTDTLDAGVVLLSATPSQGSCSGTTTITCNLGTLAGAASATIALLVRAIATGAPINNTASVSATGDSNTGNNSASAPAIPAATAADAPTLSEWALLLLASALGVSAVIVLRP